MGRSAGEGRKKPMYTSVMNETANLIIRPERSPEIEEIADLVEAAFKRPAVRHLLNGLRSSNAWRAGFVAERDGEILGHVAFTRGWIDAPTQLFEVLVLSPVAVRPDSQRQGIGSHLVREAVASMAVPLIFLEGSPTYYGRLGFQRASEHGFLPPSPRIPDVAFQVHFGPGYEPEMSGRLVYPDAFWEHDSVGRRETKTNC
jgi:putative acetyltransferase